MLNTWPTMLLACSEIADCRLHSKLKHLGVLQLLLLSVPAHVKESGDLLFLSPASLCAPELGAVPRSVADLFQRVPRTKPFLKPLAREAPALNHSSKLLSSSTICLDAAVEPAREQEHQGFVGVRLPPKGKLLRGLGQKRNIQTSTNMDLLHSLLCISMLCRCYAYAAYALWPR